jgi:hypothetical protein
MLRARTRRIGSCRQCEHRRKMPVIVRNGDDDQDMEATPVKPIERPLT